MTPETGKNPGFKIERPDFLDHPHQQFTPRIHFKLSNVDDIILETQEQAADWVNRKNVDRLRKIAKKLIDGLEITVKDGKPMKVPTFSVGPMNRKTFGRYIPGRNELGILETASINERRLESIKEDGEVAVHLVMILLCAWRHQTGGTGTLDRLARKQLKSYGFTLGKRGIEDLDHQGKFADVCSSGNIGKPPNIKAMAAEGEGEGNSTNRLWSCNCQRARVGRGQFLAHCPKCGREFLLGDHVGNYPEGTKVTDTPLADRREV